MIYMKKHNNNGSKGKHLYQMNGVNKHHKAPQAQRGNVRKSGLLFSSRSALTDMP